MSFAYNYPEALDVRLYCKLNTCTLPLAYFTGKNKYFVMQCLVYQRHLVYRISLIPPYKLKKHTQ